MLPAGSGKDRSQRGGAVRELTWQELEREIQALARRIERQFQPDAVVGLAHGGVFVGGILARALSCEFFPFRLGPRSRDRLAHRGRLGDLPPEVRGRKLLVVDDVASSGDLLELTRALALKAGAKQVKTASLVCRDGGYAPHWSSSTTDALVVFPWDYEPVVEDARFEVKRGPDRRP